MKTVLGFLFVIFLALFSLYVSVQAYPDYFGGIERATAVRQNIERVAYPLWDFARPLLQLTLILLILEAATRRLGIDWSLKSFRIMWDIRALIAAFVVVTFCIAALGGSRATETIKDVALVVIGFYFGGLGRPRSGESTAGQVTRSTPAGSGGAPERYETGGDEERAIEETNAFSTDETGQRGVAAPKGSGESLGENTRRAQRGLGDDDNSLVRT